MSQQRKAIFIFGPMAVGKMTVGQALQKKGNFDLLHNHHSIEFTLNFYGYDTAGFTTINEGIRQLVFDTIASDPDKSGFIFTFVWAFDEESDWAYMKRLEKVFLDRGWNTYFVELSASLEVRLERNKSAHRLSHKPSKKNTGSSEEILLAMTKKHRFNSHPGEIEKQHHLKIDNTEQSADSVADQIFRDFAWEL